MENTNFEMEKSFGLGVLLKLTRECVRDIKISSCGDKFISHVSREKLNRAVETTLKTRNIKLECR